MDEMDEKALIKKSGNRFFDMSVCITQIICLGLLDPADSSSIDQLKELTDDLERDELSALFGKKVFDDGDEENWPEQIINYFPGWLIVAYVAQPRRISFDRETGEPTMYSYEGISMVLRVYAETFEETLRKVADKAAQYRERIFNEARREQGLPEKVISLETS